MTSGSMSAAWAVPTSARIIPGFASGTMLDRWFSVIKLPMSWRQFHQLPRNPAYKYEYLEEAAWLSPRPKFYSTAEVRGLRGRAGAAG